MARGGFLYFPSLRLLALAWEMPLALNLGAPGRALLLKKCAHVIDTFDPKKTTVDSYVEDCPELKDKTIGVVEQKFIHQVFYGVVRYQKFLKLFVTSFLYRNSTETSRAEQSIYMVLAYLLFFRLEELGFAELRLFFNCGASSPPTLHALLQYALNQEELERWVKVEWCKIYDTRYIEEDIIGKLQSFVEELRPMTEEVELKATGTIKSSDGTTLMREKKKPCSPKPFNLTQPKPRLIPEPEVINREVKAVPLPASTYGLTLADIEEERKKRKEEIKAQVLDKYSDAHEFESAARRDEGEREELARKVEAARMAECTFKPKTCKFVPPTEEAIVRSNTTSVLREHSLLNQKQAKEYEILKRYEQELHDPSEFYRWQEEMRAKDNHQLQEQVVQRIMEMQMTRESAIEAQKAERRKKAIAAEQQKEDIKMQQEIFQKQEEFELQARVNLCQEMAKDRENAKVAGAEILKARNDHAEQMRKEKEEALERKRLEDEQDLERRKEIIRQIRALEKVPVERFKGFDRAEAPAQGLLEEMSYMELIERLAMIKGREKKAVEEKRERQVERKLEKQQEIHDKAETLARIRERARGDALSKQEEARRKKQEEEELKQRLREKAVEEVASKIQQKRQQKEQEELKLKREMKEKAAFCQFVAAGSASREAGLHAGQNRGLEREARARQERMLAEQCRSNEVKSKEGGIKRANRQKELEELGAMREAVRDRIDRAKEADRALKAEVLDAHNMAAAHQSASTKRLKEELGHSALANKPAPEAFYTHMATRKANRRLEEQRSLSLQQRKPVSA